MNLEGLNVDWKKLFSLPKHYWEDDMIESISFLKNQVGGDLPERIKAELQEQTKRIDCMLEG